MCREWRSMSEAFRTTMVAQYVYEPRDKCPPLDAISSVSGKQDCAPAEYLKLSYYHTPLANIGGPSVGAGGCSRLARPWPSWAQLRRLHRQPFAFAKERLNFAMPPIQRS